VPGYEPFAVASSREHTDANVLCRGGQMLGEGLARHLVSVFLETAYAGGRHQARLDKIAAVEARFMKES
jgi:ribose 5-phosphate isomerase B